MAQGPLFGILDYASPVATSVAVSEAEAPPLLTGPVYAAALPFPVMDEGEMLAASPASLRFDANIQDMVARTDRVAEEAADMMPALGTNALTVDFGSQTSRRDEAITPESGRRGTQYFNIGSDVGTP